MPGSRASVASNTFISWQMMQHKGCRYLTHISRHTKLDLNINIQIWNRVLLKYKQNIFDLRHFELGQWTWHFCLAFVSWLAARISPCLNVYNLSWLRICPLEISSNNFQNDNGTSDTHTHSTQPRGGQWREDLGLEQGDWLFHCFDDFALESEE